MVLIVQSTEERRLYCVEPMFVFFIRHGIRVANVGKVKKSAAVLSLPCMNSETGTYSTTTFLTALPLSV